MGQKVATWLREEVQSQCLRFYPEEKRLGAGCAVSDMCYMLCFPICVFVYVLVYQRFW